MELLTCTGQVIVPVFLVVAIGLLVLLRGAAGWLLARLVRTRCPRDRRWGWRARPGPS